MLSFSLFSLLLIGANGCDRTITLYQSDFDSGTVRITEANTLVLFGEDIVFNPNSNWEESPNEAGAYFPRDFELYPGSSGIVGGSFRLGFFSGLSLEANNIEVNLNGFTFKVSKEFQIQQRFFTLIGVGKGPFISGERPADFGDNIEVNNIHIHNGILGLSAHHGIHGNFVSDIEINNLIIKDFELAGIHLNGCNNVDIKNVEIGPSTVDIPVLGRYTQARGGLISFRKIRDRILSENLSETELNERYGIEFEDASTISPSWNSSGIFNSSWNSSLGDDGTSARSGLYGQTRNVVEIVNRLIKGMDYLFNYKVNGVVPSVEEDGLENVNIFLEALQLFDNNNGLPDGGAQYGIVINSAGNAVQWFGAQTTQFSSNVMLSDVHIHDLNGNPTESIVYVRSDGEHVTGPFKSTLPMQLLLDLDSFDVNNFDLLEDSIDNYHGNLLTDAQMAVAIYGNEDEKQLTTIDDEIIDWAKGSSPLQDGKLVCNGDAQFHMIKGLVGIRVDRTNNIIMNDISIERITNHGKIGSQFCNTLPNNNINIDQWDSHPQTPMTTANFKYQGRVARAIALTDVIGFVELNDIKISDVVSFFGSAIGIDLIGASDKTAVIDLTGDILINDIISGITFDNDDDIYYRSIDSFPNYNVLTCSLNDAYNQNAIFDTSAIGTLTIAGIDGPNVCSNEGIYGSSGRPTLQPTEEPTEEMTHF